MYGFDNVECWGIENFFRDCIYIFGVNIDCSGFDEYVSVVCIKLDNVLFICEFIFFFFEIVLFIWFNLLYYYNILMNIGVFFNGIEKMFN